MGIKTEIGWTPRRRDGTMFVQMRGSFCCRCRVTDFAFARPGFSVLFAGIDVRCVVLVGLNRPFAPEYFLSRWPPCRIPSGQPPLCPVHTRRCVKFAPTRSQCIVLMPAFALVRAPLRQRLDFAVAFSWQRLWFAHTLSAAVPRAAARAHACLLAAASQLRAYVSSVSSPLRSTSPGSQASSLSPSFGDLG